MRQWGQCRADDVRMGNVVSVRGVTDEVTGKRPSSMGGNSHIFFDLRDHGTVEIYQDEVVEVYR